MSLELPFKSSEHDSALFHRGAYDQVLKWHEQHVRAVLAGRRDAQTLVGRLFNRITDSRMLHVALDRMSRSSAPGPDRVSAQDLLLEAPYALCRDLEHDLRSRSYRPGRSRVVNIAKIGKPGTRPITIQSVVDRLVAKSGQLILQPLAESWFADWSFGGRPHRGREHALVEMLERANQFGRWVCVVDDVKSAFDVIPIGPLCQLATNRFGADVGKLLDILARNGRKPGIRQGSPLSSFLCNLYFDEYLDQMWNPVHPEHPLFRYVDDVLVLTSNQAEAKTLHGELIALCREAGTPLKAASDNICDLQRGQQLAWLGYKISGSSDQVAIRIGEFCWLKLQDVTYPPHKSFNTVTIDT